MRLGRQVQLTAEQRRELEQFRDGSPKPYLRERAAALLKVADGEYTAEVARSGLLRRREPDTLYTWLGRASRLERSRQHLPGADHRPHPQESAGSPVASGESVDDWAVCVQREAEGRSA